MKLLIKNKGFTLAEMLVSLTLIGVIATLTIPIVTHNAEKRANTALLRKALAKLDTVVEMAQTEEVFQPFNCYYDRNSDVVSSEQGGVFTDCANFRNYLANNLRTVKTCNSAFADGCTPEYSGYDDIFGANNPRMDNETQEQYEARLGESIEGCQNFTKESMNTRPAFVTNDGMIFISYSLERPIYAVDVNGKKGPNRFGYDVFFFTLKGSNGFTPSFSPGGCEFTEPGGVFTSSALNGQY